MAKPLKLDVVTSSDKKGLDETAAGLDGLANKSDKLGDKFKDVIGDSFALDAALEATKLKVNELSQAFADTGDKSLLKQIAASKRYQAQLEGIGKTLGGVGDDAEKSGSEISDFSRLVGANLSDTVPAFVTVQTQIDTTRAKIKAMRSDFAKSGSESILGNLKGAEADLKSLENVASSMGTKFAQDGAKAGNSFGDALAGALPDAAPIIAGVGAAAAPAIGAAVAAAVTAGFGIGVIGLGAVVLKNNAQVKAAFTGLSQDISSTFTDAASPMIQPLVNGLNDLDGVVKDIEPDLQSMFAAAAPAATELLDGIAGFTESIAPDFASAMQDAAPAVDAVAQALPQLGSSLGEALDLMASTPGIAGDISDAMSVVDTTIVATGVAVRVLGQIWQTTGLAEFAHLVHGVSGEFTTLKNAVDGNNGSVAAGVGQILSSTEATNLYNTSLDHTSQDLRAQATEIDVVIAAQQKYISEMQGADDANLQLHQSLLTFGQELKKGARNWNENTAAGIKQVGNLNAVNDAYMHLYNANITLNGATVKNTSAALKGVSALYNTAKAAGATKSELATLKREVNQLKDALNSLKSKTITVRLKEIATHDSGAGFAAANQLGIKGHAAGGSFGPGPMLVGEQGPEIVVPSGSGTVIPNNRLGATLGGAGSAQPTVVCVHLNGSTKALITSIAAEIRGSHGGNVQIALGGHA